MDDEKKAMREHTLKTDPAVFADVLSGAKTFEIRFNDRGFEVGDTLHLLETEHDGADMRSGAPLIYTGREVTKTISHILTGYGLGEGWCCLSFAMGAAAPADSDAAFDAWASHPDRGGKLPIERHKNGAPKDSRTYSALYGWRAGVAWQASRQSAQAADLRDDVIESLTGELAEMRALCDDRGRRLEEMQAAEPSVQKCYEDLESVLERLVDLCNNGPLSNSDEVIAAEAAQNRLYKARRAVMTNGLTEAETSATASVAGLAQAAETAASAGGVDALRLQFETWAKNTLPDERTNWEVYQAGARAALATLPAVAGDSGAVQAPAVGAEPPRRLIDDSDFGWTG